MSLRTTSHSAMDDDENFNRSIADVPPSLRLLDLISLPSNGKIQGSLATSNSPASDQCGDVPFGYFMLTIYWPSSYCNSGKCLKVPNNWVIHGLWPNYWNGSWPQYCCDIAFDQSTLSSVSKLLELKWPSLIDVEEDTLWEHEWSKHGTCCYNNKRVGGEFKYFSETMNMYDQIPLRKWLEEAAIVPSNHASYNIKHIYNAIQSNFKKRVAIDCIKDPDSKKSMIDSIYFCFDRITLEPINCPGVIPGKCPLEVIYPKSDKF